MTTTSYTFKLGKATLEAHFYGNAHQELTELLKVMTDAVKAAGGTVTREEPHPVRVEL